MTRAPPRTLPQDLFIDVAYRNPSSIEPRDTTHTSDADTIALAAAQELNRRNAQANQNINPYYRHQQHDCVSTDGPHDRDTLTSTSTSTSKPTTLHDNILFQSHTTAPSPIQELPFEDSILSAPYSEEPPSYSPSSSSDIREDNSRGPLQIATAFPPAPASRSDSLNSNGGLSAHSSGQPLAHKSSSSSLRPVSRTPSLRQAVGKAIGSTPGSNYPSPIISAMGSVTPLPSPLLSNDSPGPWKQLRGRSSSRASSREGALPPAMHDSVLITTSGESVASALAHQSKRRVYAGLNVGHASETSSGKVEHTRNRSISEYIPDPKGIPKRQTTVAGPHGNVPGREVNGEPHIRREPHLSEVRGLAAITKPPTPPPSESSQSNDGSASKKSDVEYFAARGRKDGKLRRWRAIKELGQGTFSRVVLATSQMNTEDDEIKGAAAAAEPTAAATGTQLARKTLVAIKVCEHGPRGGASEDRIEMSLKRELEIMQSIDHPSLVHLKAWNIEPTRALLVISYCPGGDLFDVATTYRSSLTAPLLRRIFSELVGAVMYLHDRRIVHRDIKLENVLVNVPPAELTNPAQDWIRYPYSVITLTDLGLSRFVADDEKLETRCGSDDYAAPEVILGQAYDGRATDAWSLGVLLYALVESRLPFDPHPRDVSRNPMRSRTSHRIARVEWSWIMYAGDDGDHDADEAKFERDGLLGAMQITEGLLRRARARWDMRRVAEHEWVRGGVMAEGGLRFREEEEGEEVE